MGIFNRSNAKHDRAKPDSSNVTFGDPSSAPAPVHDAPASSGHVERTPKRSPPNAAIAEVDGWPAGKYKLEVFLDEAPAQIRELEVKAS